MKKIYLFLPNDDYGEKIFQYIENKDLKLLKIEKRYKQILRIYFSYRISKYINLPFKYPIFKYILKFNEIKDSEDNYFIFFDNTPWILDKNFLQILKKKYLKSKFILYLWNTLDTFLYDKIEKFAFYKIITFDKKDSLKYGFIYYPQVHSIKMLSNYKNIKIDQKVIFIGKDKNRLDLLNKIFCELRKLKISPNYFYIVKDNKKYDKKLPLYNYLFDNYIPYELVLKKLSSSKVILDIVKENQEGLTLRILEALFMNKKVITNNYNVKNYNFYNENNVFILNENKKLDEFLKKKYIEINEDIKNKYDVNEWFNFILNIL